MDLKNLKVFKIKDLSSVFTSLFHFLFLSLLCLKGALSPFVGK